MPVQLHHGHQLALHAGALLTAGPPGRGPRHPGDHETLARLLARRAPTALTALAGSVVVALVIGWWVLGWSWQLRFPVGVVVAGWLVGELVHLVVARDDRRQDPPR